MGVLAGAEEGLYRTSVASVCHYFNDVVKPLYMYKCAYAAATAASGAPATDGIEEAYIYCLRSDNTEGVVCAAPTFASPFAHTLDTTDAPTTVVIGRAKDVKAEIEKLNLERPTGSYSPSFAPLWLALWLLLSPRFTY